MEEPQTTVVLVCGYLGSGKTTALSFILRLESMGKLKTAVLVNDFGALPMDAALLPKGDFHLAEINNGSIFCVCVKSNLLEELAMIADDIRPDILLVEATGLAEPRDFPALLEAANAKAEKPRKYNPEHPTVCVVDAVNFPKLSTILPALNAQVQSANLILLNKTDLALPAETAEIAKQLRKLNPSAEIEETRNAKFKFDLEKLRALARENTPRTEIKKLCEIPPQNIERYEFRADSHPNRTKFYAIIDKWRQNILRAKGVVDFGDGPTLVEVVNGVISSKPWRNGKLPEPNKIAAISFVLKNANPEKLDAELAET